MAKPRPQSFSRALDDLARPDTDFEPPERKRQRRLETRRQRKGGEKRVANHLALLREFPRFLLELVNVGWRDSALSESSPEVTVRTLDTRYGARLSRRFRRSRLPYTPSRNRQTLVPFALAAYGIAPILLRITSAPRRSDSRGIPERVLEDVVQSSEDYQEILRHRWGSAPFAAQLFSEPDERHAWIANCWEAGRWVELLRHRDVQAKLWLVRRCAFGDCLAPFFLQPGSKRARFHERCRKRAGRLAQVKSLR